MFTLPGRDPGQKLKGKGSGRTRVSDWAVVFPEPPRTPPALFPGESQPQGCRLTVGFAGEAETHGSSVRNHTRHRWSQRLTWASKVREACAAAASTSAGFSGVRRGRGPCLRTSGLSRRTAPLRSRRCSLAVPEAISLAGLYWVEPPEGPGRQLDLLPLPTGMNSGRGNAKRCGDLSELRSPHRR